VQPHEPRSAQPPVQVSKCLVEGNSIRSTERMTGTHRDTICRLLVEVGDGCAKLMDEQMRELPCRLIEVDEIWAYVGKKQRHMTRGSVATFRALQFCACASHLAGYARNGSRGSDRLWSLDDASYEFGWPIGLLPGVPPERNPLIDQAKSQLTNARIASPPYDGITFDVRYP
jgi:hypothetical protein